MKELTKLIINSAIAGSLVFLGSAISELTEHGFTNLSELCLGLIIGLITGLTIFLTKVQTILQPKAKKGTLRLFEFI